MPRTAKTVHPKARTRKAQPAEQPIPAPGAEYSSKELELRSKYPHHNILPQSYRVAGAPDRPGWGHKHTVLVHCATEGCTSGPRCVATSDLQFDTTRYSGSCSAHIKANRRRTRQVKKSLA